MVIVSNLEFDSLNDGNEIELDAEAGKIL
jgi:hypothetical protein